MGAKPIICMNIVCFPDELDTMILKDILLGGADKVKESGALLVGGHSIKDSEPKYGLSVVGIIETKKVLKNVGVREGDKIFMTKRLGTGFISTGVKKGLVDKKDIDEANYNMTRLNKYVSEAISNYNIGGCTDITGFGLAGHLTEMLSESKYSAEIEFSKLNYFKKALELSKNDIVFSGLLNNKKYYNCGIKNLDLDEKELNIIYDPQTAGGLLFTVRPEEVDLVKEALDKSGDEYCIIGNIVEKRDKKIYIKR